MNVVEHRLDWPTQKRDIQVAKQIFKRYKDQTYQHRSCVLSEVVAHLIDQADTQPEPPVWLKEMFNHFIKYYGYEHGYAIISMVFTKLLMENETKH